MRLSTMLRTLVLGFAMVSLFACTQKAESTEVQAPAEEMVATDTAKPEPAAELAAPVEDQAAVEETAPETN